MEENQRRFIRVETSDLLEIRPSDGISPKKAVVKDFSMMGICFYCPVQWHYGQNLIVSYSVPGSLEEVNMRVKIKWSELIDETRGYLVGASIVFIEPEGQDSFLRYYYDKVKKLFS